MDSPHDDDVFHNPTSANDVFHAASSDTLKADDLYYFDPSDNEHAGEFVGHTFHLTLNPLDAIDSHDVGKLLFTLDYIELRGAHDDLIHLHMSPMPLHKIKLTSMLHIWDTNQLTLFGRP